MGILAALFNFLTASFVYKQFEWIFLYRGKIQEIEKNSSGYKFTIKSTKEALQTLSDAIFGMSAVIWPVVGLFTFQSSIFMVYIFIQFLVDLYMRSIGIRLKNPETIITNIKKFTPIQWGFSLFGLLIGIFVFINYNLHSRTGVNLLDYITK